MWSVIPFDLGTVSMSLHASVRHFAVFRLCQTLVPGWVDTWKAWDVVTNRSRRGGCGGGRALRPYVTDSGDDRVQKQRQPSLHTCQPKAAGQPLT